MAPKELKAKSTTVQAMGLFECIPLRASISMRQCGVNRNGYRSGGINVPPITSCQGCTGLGAPVQVSLSEREETTVKKLKHTYCRAKGCYRTVKKEGDYCKVHQGLEDQVAAGTTGATEQKQPDVTAGAAEVVDPAPPHHLVEIEAGSICAVCVGDCNAGPTPCQPGALSECINFTPWRRDDERTLAMLGLVGHTISLEVLVQQQDQDVMAAEFYAGALHLQASDNDDVLLPPMPLFLKAPQAAASVSLAMGDAAEGLAQSKIADVADEQPVSHVEEPVRSATHPTLKPTGLQALLRTPPPPPEPDGIFIPFTHEEVAALAESEVTAGHIRQLVLMGLEGQLQPVVEVEDPLAKSRRHEAQ